MNCQSQVLEPLRSPLQSVELVPNGQDRMPEKHPRSGVPHHLSNPRPPGRAIAVDGAARAGRLVAGEGTMVKPAERVLQQILALVAKLPAAMMAATIEADHGSNGLLLAGEAGILLRVLFGHGCWLQSIRL